MKTQPFKQDLGGFWLVFEGSNMNAVACPSMETSYGGAMWHAQTCASSVMLCAPSLRSRILPAGSLCSFLMLMVLMQLVGGYHSCLPAMQATGALRKIGDTAPCRSRGQAIPTSLNDGAEAEEGLVPGLDMCNHASPAAARWHLQAVRAPYHCCYQLKWKNSKVVCNS